MMYRLQKVDGTAAVRQASLLAATSGLVLAWLTAAPAQAAAPQPASAAAAARAAAPADSAPAGRRGPEQDPNGPDAVIKKVRLDQRLNNDVPLDTIFRDDSGKIVRFGDFLGKKPVLLMLIQFRCTMLCSEEMKILAESLKQMQFDVGKQFDVVVASIDDREQPALAAEYKAGYVRDYGRTGSETGWHFLTGNKENILRLADSIGYHFTYDPRTDQFAHPDGVIVLTPTGRISKYFFRLNYDPRDLRLALVEATNNKIGTPLDAFALLCYHYDPVTGKYGLAVLKLVRLGGILTVLLMGLGIVVMKGWDRHAKRRADDARHSGA